MDLHLARHTRLLAIVGVALAAVIVTTLQPSTSPALADEAPAVAEMYPKNVRVTPMPGAVLVEWDPVTAIGKNDLGFGYTGASVAAGYFATSSFDPDTNSGYQSCQVGAEKASCVIRGLVNGVSYTFQVQTATRMIAHNSPTWTGEAPGLSDFSPPSQAAIPCCDTPAPVNDVTAIVNGDNIDLTWSAPEQWGGAKQLDYAVSSPDGDEICRTQATTCQIRDYPYEIPQVFLVRGVNSGGAGTPVESNPVVIPGQPPQPPTSGKVRYRNSGAAKLSWSAPLRDGGSKILSYRVRATPGGATCLTSGALSCVIDDLTPGRSYTFAVQAQNRHGRSNFSAPIVAGRLVTPASKPRDIQADLTTTTAQLSWLKPATRGGGKLREYVVTDGRDVVCRTRNTRCEVSDLIPGSAYEFGVYAVNTSGAGKRATVQVLTPVPPRDAPAPAALPGPRPEVPKPKQTFS